MGVCHYSMWVEPPYVSLLLWLVGSSHGKLSFGSLEVILYHMHIAHAGVDLK